MLCRCWRRRYSPDAASAPSRLAAMARASWVVAGWRVALGLSDHPSLRELLRLGSGTAG